MKILNLALRNFRGIKKFDLKVDGHNAEVYGANGTGKTTIANAVCWLLAGIPATGEKGFDPKTAGSHGLRHSATITIALESGELISFGKEFYELWKRKKGAENPEFSGHTTDYTINGVPAKEKEYELAVEQACGCSADKIKMLILLGYFAEDLSVDDRRKILLEVCGGDVTDEEVIAANDLDDLTAYLLIPGTDNQYYSTDQYKKIAQERKRSLNKDLGLIPERIDEVTRKIPDAVEDEGELADKLKALEQRKAAINQEAHDLQNSDTRQEALRAAIAGIKTDLEVKRTAYIKKCNDDNEEIYAAIRDLSDKKHQTAMSISEARGDMEHLERSRDQLNKNREQLLKDYETAQATKWDEGKEVCPTCGRPLPPDKVQALREEFNRNKSQTKERINRDGQACSKSVLAEIEAKIQAAKDLIDKRTSELQDEIQRFDNLQNSIIRPVPFESISEYTELNERIINLNEEMQSAQSDADTANSEVRKIQQEKIAEIDQQVSDLNMRIAQTRLTKESQARVKELRKEKRTTAAELEKVEHGIHLCEEFVRARVRMVTDRINSHFKAIHFQLFKDQINGGLKESCEPMLQNAAGEWVEYKSANTAAKTNAGLEIIDVLNKHYGTSLPVIMDRAESVCRVAAIDEQLIRLIVSAEDAQLRVNIEKENEK